MKVNYRFVLWKENTDTADALFHLARAAKCKGLFQSFLPFFLQASINFGENGLSFRFFEKKTLKLTKDKAFFQAGTKDKRGVTAQFITTYIDADRVLKVTSKIFDIGRIFTGFYR